MYKYKIIKKSYGYVLVNETLDTHAHIPTYKGCRILLNLIRKDIEIEDKYLRKAKERLLDEKIEKKRKKSKYINRRMAC